MKALELLRVVFLVYLISQAAADEDPFTTTDDIDFTKSPTLVNKQGKGGDTSKLSSLSSNIIKKAAQLPEMIFNLSDNKISNIQSGFDPYVYL